jgi:hypothetical protein
MTNVKVLNTLPAAMRNAGWIKVGTTNDRSMLGEIQRDLTAKSAEHVAFTRGAMDNVHYWVLNSFPTIPKPSWAPAAVEEIAGKAHMYKTARITHSGEVVSLVRVDNPRNMFQVRHHAGWHDWMKWNELDSFCL